MLLEIDYSGKNEVEEEKKVKEETPIPDSKLDQRLQSLVDFISNDKMVNAAMAELKYDAKKLPLGKLTQDIIKKGYLVLKRIDEAIQNQEKRQVFQDLSSEFYTLIPHDYRMQRLPTIDNKEDLDKKIKMVEQLAEVEVVASFMGKKTTETIVEHPLDARYRQLKCNLSPLDLKGEELNIIKQYIQNTHGDTHNDYSLEVLDAFEIDRHGEREKFEKNSIGNTQLLWHGSRLTNFVGILSQGLRIAPPEAPVSGYMFGKGVYFADCVSKSANYCCPQNNTACILLCEVKLGECNEKVNADYNADKLPKGKHSTKGLGSIAPSNYVERDGVKIPMGKAAPVQHSEHQHLSLQYNEFIVYDVSQIRMKYLIKIKFNYKNGR